MFFRDVKMGYRRLKETVKQYNRKEAKFYGNIIDKLGKLEDTDADVSRVPSKKYARWPLVPRLRSFFTTDGSIESLLWLLLRLLIPVMILVSLCVAYYLQSEVSEIDCINC